MNIKGFKIKNQRLQKIWVAVALALIVAIILILVSFFIVFKKSSEFRYGKEDLFDYKTYYTKYSITTYSNKNQNTYYMEEYCSKNNDNIKFRFNTINENNNYSYIVTSKSFHIKSENQISEFENNINLEINTNILSLATFIELYSKVNDIIKNNTFNNSSLEISVEEKDDKITYVVIFKDKNDNLNEIAKYKKALINGMNISKFELILDIHSKKPLEYIVYLENGKSYIDIIYNEFEINAKFDEKVFSF